MEEACYDPTGFTDENTKGVVRVVLIAIGVVIGLFLLDFLLDKRCFLRRGIKKTITKKEIDNSFRLDGVEEGRRTATKSGGRNNTKFGILELHQMVPEEEIKQGMKSFSPKSDSSRKTSDASPNGDSRTSGTTPKSDSPKRKEEVPKDFGSLSAGELEVSFDSIQWESARVVTLEVERKKSKRRIKDLEDHMDSIIDWHKEQSRLIRSTRGRAEIKPLERNRHKSVAFKRGPTVATSTSFDGSIHSHAFPPKGSQTSLPNKSVVASEGRETPSQVVTTGVEERVKGNNSLLQEFAERDRSERALVRSLAKRRSSRNSADPSKGSQSSSRDKSVVASEDREIPSSSGH